jgi:hypothetical protein
MTRYVLILRAMMIQEWLAHKCRVIVPALTAMARTVA